MKLNEVFDQPLEIIHKVRPVGMATELNFLPNAQILVSFTRQFVSATA